MSNATNDRYMLPGMIMPKQPLYETSPLTPYEEAAAKLEELEMLYVKQDAVRADYAYDVDMVVPDEIKRAVEAIDLEYAKRLQDVLFAIQSVENEIKTRVATLGVSVKCEALHAVYNSGRVTWNNDRLEGYAAAHPEILPFRKVGDPYVTIRKVK